jgi:hypothetical protein
VNFAETRWRALVLAARLASGSASTCRCVSGFFFVFCPVYASLRRTASLYKTRSDALAAQRFSALRTSALVLANADARASRSSASTTGALPLPLLFPFCVGTAVGDAISTSCGERGEALLFALAFGEGGCSESAVWEGPGCPVEIGNSTTLGNLETEGRAETGGEGSDAKEFFAEITSGLRISGAEMDCKEGQPNRVVDFCFIGELKDVAVGVPGREMGCILTGGGCCGVPFPSGVSEAVEPSPGRVPCAP